MDKATKAALLSALIFPGVGHFYLGLYRRGTALALAAAVSLYFAVVNALEVARAVLQQIEAGQLPPDLLTLTQSVMAQMQHLGPSIRIASLAFLACWVIGILDAHRAAERRSS
ncbi:MAG: hypothetical protein P8Y92_10925 [Halioglobus sp.]